jgi:hypothetical protein
MAGLSLSGTLTVDVGRCGLAQALTRRTRARAAAATLAGVILTLLLEVGAIQNASGAAAIASSSVRV